MDNINHPKHYNQLPIECIDVVKHFDFIIGNVIKYCWRAGLKNSDTELDDLKKAKFYIEYKIKMFLCLRLFGVILLAPCLAQFLSGYYVTNCCTALPGKYICDVLV